jgi:hypothetical protein
MKTRSLSFATVAGALGAVLGMTLWACSGDDSTPADGGNDATTEAGNDAAKTDGSGNDGSGNDAATETGSDAATDGGGTDGGGTDATVDGGTFTCGTTTCDSTTQYCNKTKAGLDGGLPDAANIPDAAKIDGGQVEVDTCMTYPTTCTADGGTPDCACVQGNCSACSQSGTAITVTCP